MTRMEVRRRNVGNATRQCWFLATLFLWLSRNTAATAAAAAVAGSAAVTSQQDNKRSVSCDWCPLQQATVRNRSLVLSPVIDSCDDLLEYANQFLSQESMECVFVQSISSLCGCHQVGYDDPCTLCPDGRPVPFPERPVTTTPEFFRRDKPREGPLFPMTVTCEIMEAYLLTKVSNNNECTIYQDIFAQQCGCASFVAHNDACQFCPHTTSNDRVVLDGIAGSIYIDCEMAKQIAHGIRNDSETCELLHTVDSSGSCCHNNNSIYDELEEGHSDQTTLLTDWGADTRTKQRVYAWVPRASSFLVILACLAVYADILTDPLKRRRIYHQLILFMITFDLITALTFATSSLPIYHEDGEIDVYGARGTKTTCQIQGFFVQLGITSTFYNLSLAVYYKLVIVNNWREEQLKRRRILFQGLPSLVGLTLALSALPFYDVQFIYCSLSTQDRSKLLMFQIVPIVGAIFALTATMGHVYLSVRDRTNKSQRWNFRNRRRRSMIESQGGMFSARTTARGILSRNSGGSSVLPGARSNLERKVFWQSFSYLLAFYLTWPIYGVALLLPNRPFWFGIITLIVAPIQGLSNALVYFRARFIKKRGRKKRRKHSKHRKRSHKRKHSHAPTPPPPALANSPFWRRTRASYSIEYNDTKDTTQSQMSSGKVVTIIEPTDGLFAQEDNEETTPVDALADASNHVHTIHENQSSSSSSSSSESSESSDGRDSYGRWIDPSCRIANDATTVWAPERHGRQHGVSFSGGSLFLRRFKPTKRHSASSFPEAQLRQFSGESPGDGDFAASNDSSHAKALVSLELLSKDESAAALYESGRSISGGSRSVRRKSSLAMIVIANASSRRVESKPEDDVSDLENHCREDDCFSDNEKGEETQPAQESGKKKRGESLDGSHHTSS